MLLVAVIVYVGSFALVLAVGSILSWLIGAGLIAGFEPWQYLMYTGSLAAMLTGLITWRLGYIKEWGDSLFRVPKNGKMTSTQRVRLSFLCIFMLAGAGLIVFIVPLPMMILTTLSSLGFLLVGLFVLAYLLS